MSSRRHRFWRTRRLSTAAALRQWRVVVCGTSTLTPRFYERRGRLRAPRCAVTYAIGGGDPITVAGRQRHPTVITGSLVDGRGGRFGWPFAGVEIEIRRADWAFAPSYDVGRGAFARGSHARGPISIMTVFPTFTPLFPPPPRSRRRDPEGPSCTLSSRADVINPAARISIGGYRSGRSRHRWRDRRHHRARLEDWGRLIVVGGGERIARLGGCGARAIESPRQVQMAARLCDASRHCRATRGQDPARALSRSRLSAT